MFRLNKETKYVFATYVNYKSGKLTGAHKRYLELIEGLAREEKVIVFSKGIPQLNVNQNIELHDIKETKIDRYIPNHVLSIFQIARTLKKDKLTNVKAVAFGAANVLGFRLAGIKNIVTLFREDLIEYRKSINTSKIKLIYYYCLERAAVMSSSRIIVQCKADKQRLLERHKSQKDINSKIFIQINNANASWMKQEHVHHFDKIDEIKTILFIGHFSNPRKGHGILLPAIAKLIDEGKKIRLIVAGDGDEFTRYKDNYSKYKSIEFLGHVNNINALLEEASFMIVPSLIDSCPNTVLEGLNAGIAVYGSNSGGIPDLLLNNKYLFEPSVEGIYQFVGHVIETEQFVNDALEQQKRKESLCFDWSKKIKALIDMV